MMCKTKMIKMILITTMMIMMTMKLFHNNNNNKKNIQTPLYQTHNNNNHNQLPNQLQCEHATAPQQPWHAPSERNRRATPPPPPITPSPLLPPPTPTTTSVLTSPLSCRRRPNAKSRHSHRITRNRRKAALTPRRPTPLPPPLDVSSNNMNHRMRTTLTIRRHHQHHLRSMCHPLNLPLVNVAIVQAHRNDVVLVVYTLQTLLVDLMVCCCILKKTRILFFTIFKKY